MDVYIENVWTLDDFDIVQTAGYQAAYLYTVPTPILVTDGNLTIQFVPSSQNPMISGVVGSDIDSTDFRTNTNARGSARARASSNSNTNKSTYESSYQSALPKCPRQPLPKYQPNLPPKLLRNHQQKLLRNHTL
jgi:hypothetical protein